MGKRLDISKIKTFALKDLFDRTIKIIKLTSDEQWTVAVAFDIETGESFILTCDWLPPKQTHPRRIL